MCEVAVLRSIVKTKVLRIANGMHGSKLKQRFFGLTPPGCLDGAGRIIP